MTCTGFMASTTLPLADRIGAIGQGDIFTAQTTATSLMVSSIPCDGRTIYVQLGTQINGTWLQVGPYTYTACRMVTLSASPSPSPLLQAGGTVKLTGTVENFSPATQNVQLQVTESLYPRLPICVFNFWTGRVTCTYPSPTVIGSMPLTLVPGAPQPFTFNATISPLPQNYQYARTFVFAATVTDSITGAVLGSATVSVTQY